MDRDTAPEPGITAAEPGITAAAFRRLPDDLAGELLAAGVAAVVGSTMGGRRSPGPTWISLSSPWGSARLIRHGDGSFEASAYRSVDGRQVLRRRGPAVAAADLHDVIDAVARPDRPAASVAPAGS